MSIQNSYLAQPKYNYDTVVAVTQKALNNAIETYYEDATTFSQVTYYFIKDGSGNPQAIDKATLLANYTSGIDPLATTVSISQQKTLSASQFYFAFSFKIGNPQMDLSTNYITLNPGSNSVRYYLLCFQLQVAFWNPDNKSWVAIKQTTAKEFNIYANINLKNVLDNTNLPASVQAAVNTLGGTGVNIQQLIFDLDSAVVDPASTLTQLDNTCSVFKPLMQQFANAYFRTYTLQSGALNYALTTTNTSTLVPTGMEWFIGGFVDGNGNAMTNPTQDQQDLATLNYLFSTNGDTLNAGAQFNWNWLEDNGNSHNPDLDTNADVNKYDGTISINRDAFAKYLQNQLNTYVRSNCYRPNVYLWNAHTDFFSIGVHTSNADAPQAFMLYQPSSSSGEGDVLLFYNYQNSSSATGIANPNDTCCMEVIFTLKFIIKEQTAKISQTFEIHIKEFISNKSYESWPVLKELSDSFDIVIDDLGLLSFQNIPNSSTIIDNSNWQPLYEGAQINTIFGKLMPENIQQIPPAMPKQFVFPGGNAFTFQDAQFSNNSDIVCHVTYKAES